jgi:hypothetical protein
LQRRKITSAPYVVGHFCSVASGTDTQWRNGVLVPSTPLGISAGRVMSFRVVSRSQARCFRSSTRFMRLVRFPAARQVKSRRDPAFSN